VQYPIAIGEACAAIYGLKLDIDLGFTRVFHESDCAQLVHYFKIADRDESYL
jgi:hypothetical protein